MSKKMSGISVKEGSKMRPVLLVLALVFLLCVSGCTRNNGDIGPWFGTWQLEEITVDGELEPTYEGNIFWKFQNSVFRMLKVSTADYVEYAEWRSASWEEKDGYLFVNFLNYDDRNPVEWAEEGSGEYSPFSVTHLLPGAVSELKIESVNGSTARLSFRSPADGKMYGYQLKKQG